MKNLQPIQRILLLAILVSTTLLNACKKNKETEEIKIKQTQQINQVLPQKYIDTLKNLGLTLHDGTNPPIVNGIYLCSPLKLKASNILSDFIGNVFIDGKLKIENQNNNDFTLNIYGKQILNVNDTSIVSAIAGNGNNFTIYSKIKTNAGSNFAYFAVVMSGIMNGSNIKNFEYGLINIDNTNGGSSFIKEGQARVVYDSDSVSVSTTVFRMMPTTITNSTKCVGCK
jgi:hypothetical protein